MNFIKTIKYICSAIFFLTISNSAIAKNTITRTAEYNKEIPDTFIVRSPGMSNSSKRKVLDIMLEIRTKGKPFDIYSIELLMHDSIIKPLIPFSMTVSEVESQDSIIAWDCNIEFPYRNRFFDYDKWILYTSRGQFEQYLVPEDIRQNHAKQLSEQRKQERNRATIGIILTGILTIGIIYFYRKYKRTSIEEKLLIKQQFESKDHMNRELQKQVEALYADRWNIFNKLCDEYFIKKDAHSDTVRLSVYKELEKQIDYMRSSQSLAELEKLVNTYNDNILQRISIQIPQLTKKDTAFLTYLYSGFSPRAICLFTDIKIKNFYNRRTRLRDKILASGAQDCEEFASRM